ncbi:hypothetical protein Q31a_07750 [Aureliella helgolandensis]|uniref:Uncharacterized protein n=1 Tax=Aureliella helgolandensis TaxID=2527968 RepID=A0A518G1L2_9BACT|nr:hypothetical protein Q31a_07750 [Aureliella helgolandensis]
MSGDQRPLPVIRLSVQLLEFLRQHTLQQGVRLGCRDAPRHRPHGLPAEALRFQLGPLRLDQKVSVKVRSVESLASHKRNRNCSVASQPRVTRQAIALPNA